MNNLLAQQFYRELGMEIPATRKCLEKIDKKYFDYKPHEKSMLMGYLAVIVAEIPKWLSLTIKKGEIDLAKWEKFNLKTNADLLNYFDENIKSAKDTLQNTNDKELEEMFYLKMGDKELMKSSKRDSISMSLRHWVHHRGQLTVYMRLNDLPVPAIYGPSADEKEF